MSGTTKQPASWETLEKTVIKIGTIAWIPAIASAGLDIGLYTYYLIRWLRALLLIFGSLSAISSHYGSAYIASTIGVWIWRIAEGVVELIITLVYVLKTFVPKCKAKEWQFLATEPSFGPKVPKILLFAILLEVFSGYEFGGAFVIIVMILIYLKAPVTNPWKGGTLPAKVDTTTAQQPAQWPASSTQQASTQQPAQWPNMAAQQPSMMSDDVKSKMEENAEVATYNFAGGAVRICQMCGSQLSSGAKFCENCGAKAAETESVKVPSSSSKQTWPMAQTNPPITIAPTGGSKTVSGSKVREVPISRMFDGTNKAGIVGKIALMNDGLIFTTSKKDVFSLHINDIARVSPGAKQSFLDIEMKNGNKISFKLMGANDWITLINNQLRASSESEEQTASTVVAQQVPQQQVIAGQSEQELADVRQRVAVIEKNRMEKLKKLVKVSEKIKVSQMAQILNLDEAALYDRIVDWASEYGFTLDEDVVKFSGGRKDDFIASLDNAFTDWGNKAETKEGKLE